jgi:hypothetical protein
MIWEYHRKEVADRRFDAYLTEMADQGWELFYARRGKETRVARDPDFWEVIWKRPKRKQLESLNEAEAELTAALS